MDERDRALAARLKEVRVFGSRARGDHRPGSDLDLFLLLDRNDRETRYRIHGMTDEVMLEDGCRGAPSALVMSEEEFAELLARARRLARDILNEGIVL